MPSNRHDRLMARVEEIKAAQAAKDEQLTAKDAMIATLQAIADKWARVRELIASNKTLTLSGLKALFDTLRSLAEEDADGQ